MWCVIISLDGARLFEGEEDLAPAAHPLSERSVVYSFLKVFIMCLAVE